MHPASVGGTHANRMIHRESGQLSIGPYLIDSGGAVRALDPTVVHGRLTATLRHLRDPQHRIYLLGMEEELYEVDVRTLEATQLHDTDSIPMPGTHAKGGYTAQGRIVYSNNGERGWAPGSDTGVLAECVEGEWRVVERAQFTEVTGPDGIGGGKPDGRLWCLGWDKRSVILKLLEAGEWRTYRLPKGSYTHDAGHGWYTEWPRIREVTDGALLMHMHGLFWEFPRTFSVSDASGLRPIACYEKMPVDYCAWNGRIVMGCNDASRFENRFVSQPSSNLWFGTMDDLRNFGEPAGWGGVWVGDSVESGEPSDPFLVAGFERVTLHLAHVAQYPLSVEVQADTGGNGAWRTLETVVLPAGGYRPLEIPRAWRAEWIRLVPRDASYGVSAYFHLSSSYRARVARGSREVPLSFDGLAGIDDEGAEVGGIVRPRGGDLGTLHFLTEAGYYEAGANLTLSPTDDPEARDWLGANFALGEPDLAVDAASVVMTDESGRRWRLPKTDPRYDEPFTSGWPRGIREVVTERSLMNIHGTFYELPRPSSGGLERVKPICTHRKRITDFCSWRGLLVLAGTRADAEPDGHYVATEDGKAGLWFGNVDDLWRMGKPVGVGGPWKDAPVEAAEPSDPYLMTGYDRKRVELSHDSSEPVTFVLEVCFDYTGWRRHATLTVAPGETVTHVFPAWFSAHWVRVVSDRPCGATAWFVYE